MRLRDLCATVAAVLTLSAGSPTRAAAPVELASFQAGNAGWHMGTLGVGQLDADAALEIVVPYRDSDGAWFLDAFNPDGSRIQGFPYSGGAEINVSPTLHDLDGDGRDEIFFTCGAEVIALRGNGSVLWSMEVNRSNYVPDSGFMTPTNGFYWSGGGQWMSRLPQNAVFSSQVSSPIIADLDGSGSKKLITAWKIDPDNTGNHQDFNPFINDLFGSGEWGTMGESWSGGVVFFNAATGARDYTYHLHQLVESGLALGRGETNGPLKSYVLNDSDSVVCFDRYKPHGFHGKGNLHRQFGKNQRLLSGAYQQGVDIHTADLDGDGLSEVLVPTTQLNPLWQPSETVLDDSGTVLWREWKQPLSYPLNQWQNNACMIPVNPDRDNRIDVLSFTHSHEIQFRSWNGVELVPRPGWPKNFHPFLPTPPVVGDVDGDGSEEILIGTYDPVNPAAEGRLHVFALNGTEKFALPVPGGLKHIPTIANVFGNGLAVVYRALAGQVKIVSFGSTHSGPISWATHRGSRERDGHYRVSLYPSGTPVVTRIQGGYGRATALWTPDLSTNAPSSWRVYRADGPDQPMEHVITLTPEARTYTDSGLVVGRQYVYEIAAVHGTTEVRSAPVSVLPDLNGNLIRNGGFEENSESHWDKWFTGEISWTNMVVSTNTSFLGRRSMEIRLRNYGNNGSISQFSQYGTPEGSLPVVPGTLYSFGGFFRSGGLSGNTAHWLEWSSTVTGANTNARPSRPFPDYFTPHFKPGSATGDWVYANRTFVLPPGFPNVELTHWFTATTPASGSIFLDGLFFRALPPITSSNWLQLIPFGSTWRYATAVSGADWILPGFPDELWLSGTAKLGSGSGPTNLVTLLPPKLPAYYFRRTFTLPEGRCEELLLSATCTDEGLPLQVYLNGERLQTTGIEATTGQGNALRHYDLAPFLHLLRPGANTFAITLSNQWSAGWDDVAFDVSLRTIVNPVRRAEMRVARSPAEPGAAASLDGSGQIGLNINVPSNTLWRVESTDSFDAPWRLMDVVSNRWSDAIFLPDTGQNGRLPPDEAAARFYRLRPN